MEGSYDLICYTKGVIEMVMLLCLGNYLVNFTKISMRYRLISNYLCVALVQYKNIKGYEQNANAIDRTNKNKEERS